MKLCSRSLFYRKARDIVVSTQGCFQIEDHLGRAVLACHASSGATPGRFAESQWPENSFSSIPFDARNS